MKQAETLHDDDEEDAAGDAVEDGLVILIGGATDCSELQAVFEQKYNYKVLRGESLSTVEVPVLYITSSCDGVFVVMVRTEWSLKSVDALFTETLQLEQDVPKLVMAVGCGETAGGGAAATGLGALFGIIESAEGHFVKWLVHALRSNTDQTVSRIVDQVGERVRDVRFNRFDRRLLQFRLAENDVD